MDERTRTLVLGGTHARAQYYAREAGLKRHEWIWINNSAHARGWNGTFDLVDLGPANGTTERERYLEAAEVLDQYQAIGVLTVAQRTAVPA